MLVQFTNDLIIGVEQIDNQHREWFKRLDNFWQAVRGNKKNEEIIDVLVFLQDYVKIHFQDEEKLQLEIAYPGYAAQKQQHNQYMNEIDSLLDSLNKESPEFSITIDALNSMLEWVTKHIKTLDKDLADYIKNQQGSKLTGAKSGTAKNA